jgi:hypothetical protein
MEVGMKVMGFGFFSILILSGCVANPQDSALYEVLQDPTLQGCANAIPADKSDCERRVNNRKSVRVGEYEEERKVSRSTAIPQKTVDEFLKKKFPKN